jgi:diguanylate cyclase (GGDEF)-like protein
VEDPKLTAEILLEEANAARVLGDADTVEERGRRIGAIGGGLENTQIRGLGFETIGHAQRMRGARAQAYAEYVKARDAFAGLRLYRDELRAVREIVDLQLAGVRPDQLPETTARLMMLTDEVARIERESAAADFEERLRFVQSEAALAAAKTLVENERLRATVSENRFRYSLIGSALVFLLLAGVAGLYWQQRRYAGVMRERGKEMEIAIATDFLTAVHSRRHITEAGHAAVASALAHGHHFAIAVVDIDHFKRINDRFGHAVGDEVLKAVAAAMREVCRDSDTLGRYGGEEFAVLLQGIGNEHVTIAAERLRKAVADVRVRAGDQRIVVTASVGVACLSPDDTGFDTLLIRADRALYKAKAEGRNRVVLADGSDDGASVHDPI